LKSFFEGKLSGPGLGEQVRHWIIRDYRSEHIDIHAVPDDLFVVTGDHLVALCDATLNGDLLPTQLETIASIFVTSEVFVWNLENLPNDPVNKVIHAWDMPDINYPLTHDAVMRFRRFLLTGRRSFDQDEQSGVPLEGIQKTPGRRGRR